MLSKRAAAQRQVLKVLNQINTVINDLEEAAYTINRNKMKLYQVIRDNLNRLVEDHDILRIGYVGTQATANDASSLFFSDAFVGIKTNLQLVEVYIAGPIQYTTMELLGRVRSGTNFKLADELTGNKLFDQTRDEMHKIYAESLSYLKDAVEKIIMFVGRDIAAGVEEISALSSEYKDFAEWFLSTTAFGLDDAVKWYKKLQEISSMQESEEIVKRYKRPTAKSVKFRPRDVDASFYSTGINSMTVYEDKFGNFHFTKIMPPETAFKELFISSLFRGISKTVPWNVQYAKHDTGFMEIASIGGKTYPSSLMESDFEISPEETAMYLIMVYVFDHSDLQNPDNVRVLESEQQDNQLMFIDFELTRLDNQRLTTDLDEAEDLKDLMEVEDNYFLNKEVEVAMQKQWKGDSREWFRESLGAELERILGKLNRKYVQHKASQAYKTIYDTENEEYVVSVVDTIMLRRDALLVLAKENN